MGKTICHNFINKCNIKVKLFLKVSSHDDKTIIFIKNNFLNIFSGHHDASAVLAEGSLAEGGDVPQRTRGDSRRHRTGRISKGF